MTTTFVQPQYAPQTHPHVPAREPDEGISPNVDAEESAGFGVGDEPESIDAPVVEKSADVFHCAPEEGQPAQALMSAPKRTRRGRTAIVQQEVQTETEEDVQMTNGTENHGHGAVIDPSFTAGGVDFAALQSAAAEAAEAYEKTQIALVEAASERKTSLLLELQECEEIIRSSKGEVAQAPAPQRRGRAAKVQAKAPAAKPTKKPGKAVKSTGGDDTAKAVLGALGKTGKAASAIAAELKMDKAAVNKALAGLRESGKARMSGKARGATWSV